MRIDNRAGRRTRRGFTLLEIMAVLVIIGLIVGLGGIAVVRTMDKAKQKAAVNQIAGFATPLGSFQMEVGRFPTQEEGLQSLFELPATGLSNWGGPYMDRIPKDPWSNDYHYFVRKNEITGAEEYVIVSYGNDNAIGGTGLATDIYPQGVDPATWSGVVQ